MTHVYYRWSPTPYHSDFPTTRLWLFMILPRLLTVDGTLGLCAIFFLPWKVRQLNQYLWGIYPLLIVLFGHGPLMEIIQLNLVMPLVMRLNLTITLLSLQMLINPTLLILLFGLGAWKLYPKSSFFFWRIAKCLPTMEGLYRHRIWGDPLCSICKQFPKTVKHILFLCPWTSAVWLASSLNCRIDR